MGASTFHDPHGAGLLPGSRAVLLVSRGVPRDSGARQSVTIPRRRGRMGPEKPIPDNDDEGTPVATERKRPVISDGLPSQLPDIDPEETSEWVESLDGVIDSRGAKRARYVMLRLLERARERQVGVPPLTTTDYINTIPPEREPWFPGDEHVERRLRAYIRWNAAVLVHRAQRAGDRRRRAHLDVRQLGQPLRGRLQPLLPRQEPRRRRRPGVLPGSRLPRHVRSRVPRGPADRGPARRLPPGAVAPRRRPADRTRTRG